MAVKLTNRLHFTIIILLLFTGLAQADFESQVIDLVNAERAAHGLKSLSYDSDLAAAALLHSQDMGSRDYFSHDSLDGTKFYERILDEGYNYNLCGENIAAGASTPEDVVDTWMNSPGHRANILNPDYCDIGVGYALSPGSSYNHYWTQDFGRRSGVTQCPGAVVPPPANNPGVSDGSGGCFIDSTEFDTSRSVLKFFGLIIAGIAFLNIVCRKNVDILCYKCYYDCRIHIEALKKLVGTQNDPSSSKAYSTRRI